MEISGDPEDVKGPILRDQLVSALSWLIPVLILLFVLPNASFLPLLVKWIKRQLPFMIVFVGVAVELSG
jgi:hypothetical protein